MSGREEFCKFLTIVPKSIEAAGVKLPEKGPIFTSMIKQSSSKCFKRKALQTFWFGINSMLFVSQMM